MSHTVKASDHHEWDKNSLADYGEFSERVTECNQREWADFTTGQWFYIPDEVLPPMKDVDYGDQKPNERVIYSGSWGNDNSPGASHYTEAEIFDMDDAEDAAAFAERKAEWESQEEWLESEMEEEDEDLDDEDEDEEDEEDLDDEE